MVEMLLSVYFSSNFMMGHVLKLAMNRLQNRNCLSQSSFFTYILKALERCQNEEDIFLIVVCIEGYCFAS